MPRTALRCYVDINIQAVTCPGVWLSRRDDVYVTVTLFGQVRRTNLKSPVFPLLFHDRFKFDKVFLSAYTPSQVASSLESMKVLIEVVQLSDLYEGGRLLAYYEGNARDFLYPFPSYSPTYGTTDRELLLERSLDFPGISPKLEFSTKTVVAETTSPILGTVYDEPLYSYRSRARSPRRSRSRSRSRSASRSKTYRRPTVASISRSRSVSPLTLSRRLQALDLVDSMPVVESLKPPFVVRKVGQELIGRNPGTVNPMRTSTLSSGLRKESRYLATSGSHLDGSVYNYDYELEPYVDRYGLYHTYASDTDAEIDDILSKSPRYTSVRPRSTSPVLHRSSLYDRYYDMPWSPSRSALIRDRVDRALSRHRSLERLDVLSSPSYRTSQDSDSLDSLDRLALDFERAKLGRY